MNNNKILCIINPARAHQTGIMAVKPNSKKLTNNTEINAKIWTARIRDRDKGSSFWSPFDLTVLVKYEINKNPIAIAKIPNNWSIEKVGITKNWLFMIIRILDKTMLKEAKNIWNLWPLINFKSAKKTIAAKNPKSGL